MGIILAILLFSVVIIFHELGHFTLAKLNGIRVDEFSLGLGPTIIGKEFRGCLLYTSSAEGSDPLALLYFFSDYQSYFFNLF